MSFFLVTSFFASASSRLRHSHSRPHTRHVRAPARPPARPPGRRPLRKRAAAAAVDPRPTVTARRGVRAPGRTDCAESSGGQRVRRRRRAPMAAGLPHTRPSTMRTSVGHCRHSCTKEGAGGGAGLVAPAHLLVPLLVFDELFLVRRRQELLLLAEAARRTVAVAHGAALCCRIGGLGLQHAGGDGRVSCAEQPTTASLSLSPRWHSRRAPPRSRQSAIGRNAPRQVRPQSACAVWKCGVRPRTAAVGWAARLSIVVRLLPLQALVDALLLLFAELGLLLERLDVPCL
jgi:hypothetical protein